MKKLVFITSIFPSYRKFLIDDLSHEFSVTIIASDSHVKSGFLTPKFNSKKVNFINVKYKSYLKNKIFYQKNLISNIKLIEPDYIIISGSVRDIGYWQLLLFCFIKKIKLISHSQGPFNKEKSLILKLQYSLINHFSFSHVVYTNFSLEKLKEFKIPTNKTVSIDNTILNNFPVNPETKKYIKNEILFIGRLRKGSGLDLLIETINELTKKFPDILCHVVGGGELENDYNITNNLHIKWHGKIYDDKIISNISENCSIACYPGNTGLSVVHYLSLGLPVVIHDSIKDHQGPEATYIKNNYNGLTFERENVKSLTIVLTKLLENKQLCKDLGANASKSYDELSKPSYATKFSNILK